MIEHIDITNLSHYDIGFTDHPLVCRRMASRIIDQALDLVDSSNTKGSPPRFCWTCESNNAVREWWQEAAPGRRDQFLDAVRAGWIEICAMPFNHGPTMDARQWRCCARWLPEDLRQAVQPRTVVQSDVNGFPRAGMIAMMDAGAEFLWMGINRDTGGTPVPQPSAFWWEMPDGRRAFVWNSTQYQNGYFLFESAEWRHCPVPAAADGRYRPPRRGEILDPSEEGLQRAHEVCHKLLGQFQDEGYSYERLALSTSNMWRVDNDPPLELLIEFVEAWNAAGLSPSLAITTPTPALTALRQHIGESAPTLQGEWMNWWANGAAAAPHELSASRRAKRLLTALESPLYGPATDHAGVIDECTRELCLFDEHTFGSWNSAAKPDCIDSRGQFAEKASLAYRPLALAELAVGDANRATAPTEAGIHIINPYPAPFSGWVDITEDCLPRSYDGVVNTATGEETAFQKTPDVAAFFMEPTEASQFSRLDKGKVFPDNIDDKCLRLWVEDLGANETRSYQLMDGVNAAASYPMPEIDTGEDNWPTAVRWADGELFRAPIGGFHALEMVGLAPRWQYKKITKQPTAAERREARDQNATVSEAVPEGGATVSDTGPTIIYEQYLAHPRLRFYRRRLEVYKQTRRVRVQVLLDRISKPESAEIFYVSFPLHAEGYQVQMQMGGVPFQPDRDLFPNTCRDYYPIDNQVCFSKGSSRLVLDCHDNALVELGEMNDGLKREQIPDDLSTVYATVYNNVWYCNWPGDENGVMEFAFDLYGSETDTTAHAPEAYPVVSVERK